MKLAAGIAVSGSAAEPVPLAAKAAELIRDTAAMLISDAATTMTITIVFIGHLPCAGRVQLTIHFTHTVKLQVSTELSSGTLFSP